MLPAVLKLPPVPGCCSPVRPCRSSVFGIGTIAGSVVALRIRARHPMYGAAVAVVVASCQALVIAYGNSTAVIAALQVVTGVAVSYGFTLWDTVAPAAELIGTHTTMVACALTVIGLFAAALAVGDVRRLTAP